MDSFKAEIIMTDKDEQSFKAGNKCHICCKEYIKKVFKVKDHCHVTGKYHSSTHQEYNLKLKFDEKIPVIFHNLILACKKSEKLQNATRRMTKN